MADIRARDHQAALQAAPVEQAMRESNPYQQIGASLPGSLELEKYQIGNELNEQQGIGRSLDVAFSEEIISIQGVGIGTLSELVGLMRDANVGLDSDGRPYFNDASIHSDGQSQVDNVRGVVNDARTIELANEDMYSEQRESGNL